MLSAGDRNLFKRKLGYCIAQSLSLSPNHLPDMTEILLKRTYKNFKVKSKYFKVGHSLEHRPESGSLILIRLFWKSKTVFSKGV